MALKWLFFRKKNCKNCPAAGPPSTGPHTRHHVQNFKSVQNVIQMAINRCFVFFQNKMLEFPSSWGPPYMSFCSKCQKRSKCHPNGVEIAVCFFFSKKKLQQIAQRLKASPPGPHSGNLFSRTQSSQSTTFKNHYYRVFELTNVIKCNYYRETCLTIIPCIFING